MRRTWLSMVVIVGVVGLLTLFLGLQYRWLKEASEAERDRMQKRVEADTARFAEDFNREIQAAYYNFQTHAVLWKTSDWTEFNERYAFWKERTAYPDLIREIYFVGNNAQAEPLKYNVSGQTFETSPSTETLDGLSLRLSDEKNFRPVYDDLFALAVPVLPAEKELDHIVLRRSAGPPVGMPRMPAKFGWVVVF